MRVGGSNKNDITELPTRLFVIDYLFFLCGIFKEEPESAAYFLTTFTAL